LSDTAKAPRSLFKVSAWDALPAGLAVLQLTLVLLLYVAWPGLSWGARIAWLLVYAFSVGWNLNSIATTSSTIRSSGPRRSTG